MVELWQCWPTIHAACSLPVQHACHDTTDSHHAHWARTCWIVMGQWLQPQRIPYMARMTQHLLTCGEQVTKIWSDDLSTARSSYLARVRPVGAASSGSGSESCHLRSTASATLCAQRIPGQPMKMMRESTWIAALQQHCIFSLRRFFNPNHVIISSYFSCEASCDFHDYKIWNTARWQEPTFNKVSDFIWSSCETLQHRP